MKISELTQGNSTDDSLLVIVENGQTLKTTKSEFLSSLNATFSWNGGTFQNLTVADANIQNFSITRKETPLSSTITVKAGTIFYDNDYLYVAVDDNVLKRVPLQSF